MTPSSAVTDTAIVFAPSDSATVRVDLSALPAPSEIVTVALPSEGVAVTVVTDTACATVAE